MRFLFRLDLSLHTGAGKKFWNLEVCNQTRPNSQACRDGSEAAAMERVDLIALANS